MAKDNLIEEFVGNLEFDALIALADILGIDHDYKSWFDDDYPQKEAELSVEVAEAMAKMIDAFEPDGLVDRLVGRLEWSRDELNHSHNMNDACNIRRAIIETLAEYKKAVEK